MPYTIDAPSDTGVSPAASKYTVEAPEKTAEKPADPHSEWHDDFLTSAVKPFGDYLRKTGEEFSAGVGDIKEAVSTAKSKGTRELGIGAAPEVAKAGLGAVRAISAPVTAGIETFVGGPVRKLIPQDTNFGKMAANAVEDAVAMFGPGMSEKVVGTLGKVAKSTGPIKTLMDQGVDLTLGQLEPMIAKRMEEAAKSVPILGSFIRAAERRTLDSFNVATVNKALEPIGITVNAKNGRDAIVAGQSALSAEYDHVLAKIPALHYDADLDRAMKEIGKTLEELPPGQAQRLDAVVKNRVDHRFGDMKAMDGKTFKQVESELTNISQSAKASSDAAERQFGYAVDDVKAALRDAVERQYPMLSHALQDINHAYGRFADVERAASSRAGAEARFTSGDLLRSIKRADKSPRDRQFAAGNRPLQDWAEAGHKVLGNTMPDSGTPERAMWDLMAMRSSEAGIAGAVAGGVIPAAVAAKGAVAVLPYTKVGQTGVNALRRAAPKIASGVAKTSVAGAPVAVAADQAGAQ